MAIMCSLLLVMPAMSFAEKGEASKPSVSAYEHANEKARFKRSGEVFNSKANKKIRAKKRADKKIVEAKKEAKKDQDKQDKGEGQVKVKF